MENSNDVSRSSEIRLVASPQSEVLLAALLNASRCLSRRLDRPASVRNERTLKDLVDDYERQVILRALVLSHWNQRRVAASLRVLPSTLSEKIKRLGLRSIKHRWVVAAPFASHEGRRGASALE